MAGKGELHRVTTADTGSQILLVEDSPVQAELGRRLLEQAGHRVTIARDGREALDRLTSGEPLPDLVLSDVKMPRMDGIQLCSDIRTDESLRQLRVILVTALGVPIDLVRGLEVGADNYIVKPYSDEHLLAKVEEELAAAPRDDAMDRRVSMQLTMDGRDYHMEAAPERLVKLLISTYDNTVQQNKELVETQVELRAANQSLEQKFLALESSQQALRESEGSLRSIVNVTPLIIFRIDLGGNITYLNQAVQILGYSPDELIGKQFSVLVHEDDLDKFSREKVLPLFSGEKTGDDRAPKLFDERRTGPRVSRGLAMRLKGNPAWKPPEGKESPKYGEICSAGVYDGERLMGSIGTISDITHRRQMERELRQLNEELERRVDERTRELFIANENLGKMLRELNFTQLQVIQSEKMAALGTLMGGVAHELNNPLMGALNYVQHVREHVEDEKLQGYLIKAEDNVERAGRIVQNMLSFSRVPNKDLEEVDLAKVVRNTLELVAAEYRHRYIHVQCHIPEDQPWAWGHRTGYQQVLLNLLTNARDALEEMKKDRRLDIEISTEGDHIVLAVKDNGPGIEQANLMRIFDPFFTTKEPGKGTGLGLSVSSSLIKSYGGRMSCESAPGMGAHFIIELPIEYPATLTGEDGAMKGGE